VLVSLQFIDEKGGNFFLWLILYLFQFILLGLVAFFILCFKSKFGIWKSLPIEEKSEINESLIKQLDLLMIPLF
jgi:hypothetical protein